MNKHPFLGVFLIFLGFKFLSIKAQQFVTSTGRQVLTDNGQQGMGGVAEAIFANCAELDNDQLNEIIEWVRLYQR
ncbi:hypothetical protein BvCmsKSP013_02100 [Escherichia coli]|nr:hypothetical protein JNE072951_p1-30 [Escherichia coli]BDQ79597.1 hypothetical protein JNE110611_p1-78 [Escherichia coli]BDQ84925.1 hypothetical protein PV0671_p2-78 [Escherichia coli]BDR01106.1 hypothetical protein JNE072929_p1-29 [Escherichia coli]BDR06504.1 hypothetical protein JNE102603_p1-35 [Escherichia coli]